MTSKNNVNNHARANVFLRIGCVLAYSRFDQLEGSGPVPSRKTHLAIQHISQRYCWSVSLSRPGDYLTKGATIAEKPRDALCYMQMLCAISFAYYFYKYTCCFHMLLVKFLISSFNLEGLLQIGLFDSTKQYDFLYLFYIFKYIT